MMRRSFVLFAMLPVQPAMAVPLAQTEGEALAAVKHAYGSRWLVGASSEYLRFEKPQSHFVPFFLARGAVDAVYTATVAYRETRYDNKGNATSSVSHRAVPASKLFTHFFDHNTQVYAGYRRDPKHVRALQGEHIPTVMKPLEEVDVSSADDMNAVEMSLSTLESELDDMLTKELTTLAKQEVRRFHAAADSVTIHWEYFRVRTEAVTPVFVPAWIIPMHYGDDQYKAVVCGLRGRVSAPRLYNPEAVARIGAVASVALNLLAARLGMVAVFGMAFPLATAATTLASYYGGFWAAQRIPAWRVMYRKRAQEARKTANLAKKADDDSDASTSSSSGGKTPRSKTDSTEWKRAQHLDDQNDLPNPHPLPQDPRGYYKALGVSRFASVNEIKAAFRKRAMKLHPDVVGRGAAAASAGAKIDGVDMATLNAAYQVLRRPAKRHKYDSGQDEDL